LMSYHSRRYYESMMESPGPTTISSHSHNKRMTNTKLKFCAVSDMLRFEQRGRRFDSSKNKINQSSRNRIGQPHPRKVDCSEELEPAEGPDIFANCSRYVLTSPGTRRNMLVYYRKA
jgi:hypothetical protein